MLLKSLFFLLVSFTCTAQSMKMDLVVSRIPLNSQEIPTTARERVTFIFSTKNKRNCLGIVTKQDTLSLEYLETKGKYKIFKYNDQKYYIYEPMQNDICLFVVPMKPYNRKVYSLIFRGI